MQFSPARVTGVMQWCWFERKTEVYVFCIDFCHLNAHMKKDSYPLPRIQEALESLIGTGHFSCLDLKSRFWQIKIDESLKQYTAFTVGNLGFFKCEPMPFGMLNVLATFQQLMQNCLGELSLIYCLIYLDDIVVFSHTAEEHLQYLHIVFDQYREHNLKLKPVKCNFLGRTSPTWHIESQRTEHNPVIETWRPLQSAHQLKLTLRCMPSLVLLAITGDSLRGLHILHSHLMNIWPEKKPAGNWSKCHFQRMSWRLSRHWNRCAWQLQFWLLLTTPNHSC